MFGGIVGAFLIISEALWGRVWYPRLACDAAHALCLVCEDREALKLVKSS